MEPGQGSTRLGPGKDQDLDQELDNSHFFWDILYYFLPNSIYRKSSLHYIEASVEMVPLVNTFTFKVCIDIESNWKINYFCCQFEINKKYGKLLNFISSLDLIIPDNMKSMPLIVV